MPVTERTVRTRTSPDVVWSYLSDFTTTEQWDPPTQRTVRTEGDGGVGTVYANTSKVLGRETEVTYTVVEHEAPHRLQLRGDAGRVQFLDTIELTPDGEGTTVRYTVEYEVTGVAKVGTPLATKAMEGVADDAASQMTTVLDAL